MSAKMHTLTESSAPYMTEYSLFCSASITGRALNHYIGMAYHQSTNMGRFTS